MRINLLPLGTKGSFSQFVKLLSLTLILAALPVTLLLSHQQQDIRQRASELQPNLLSTEMQSTFYLSESEAESLAKNKANVRGGSYKSQNIQLIPGSYSFNGNINNKSFYDRNFNGTIGFGIFVGKNGTENYKYYSYGINKDGPGGTLPILFNVGPYADPVVIEARAILASATFSNLSLVCVSGECLQAELPSATISSISKTSVNDNEDVTVNFTTNGKPNYVNLRIDNVEQFNTVIPPEIQVHVPTGREASSSIVWPATHITHTLGTHKVTLHPYDCTDINGINNYGKNCIAGPISNEVTVTINQGGTVKETDLYGHCAASDRFRHNGSQTPTIYCPGEWKSTPPTTECSANNENPYYYESCRPKLPTDR